MNLKFVYLGWMKFDLHLLTLEVLIKHTIIAPTILSKYNNKINVAVNYNTIINCILMGK